MAFPPLLKLLLFALAFSSTLHFSTAQVLKGKLSCLDCKIPEDFSGIKVQVKCDQVNKLVMASTETDGSFQVDLPSQNPKTQTPLNCKAKLLGGPSQLYASNKNMVSKIIQANGSNLYTISTPLAFFISCPKGVKCPAEDETGSSKTVDLPLPPEWGLPPSSYYAPFIPIIGIP